MTKEQAPDAIQHFAGAFLTSGIREFFEDGEFTNFILALSFVLRGWGSFRPDN